ncbi:hypothetical protein [Dyadobacter pollutisoli]|jgi:hypothetical protein|uniref:Uncharacterized protein n=1 Tax=Dyadobacter pollutisoli TaxID=2910158 RepID=A0A9E8SPT2_9BACT|nr:hypothetical protein [Dyadobacter pollutisoli]WAC12242.1 hypothetical protein ON006_31525 [Dyadobacter pollutisoli]
MDQETVDNVRAVIAEKERAIFNSDNPKIAATNYLIEVGYLNPDGSVSEKYRDGIIEPDKTSVRKKEKVSV